MSDSEESLYPFLRPRQRGNAVPVYPRRQPEDFELVIKYQGIEFRHAGKALFSLDLHDPREGAVDDEKAALLIGDAILHAWKSVHGVVDPNRGGKL